MAGASSSDDFTLQLCSSFPSLSVSLDAADRAYDFDDMPLAGAGAQEIADADMMQEDLTLEPTVSTRERRNLLASAAQDDDDDDAGWQSLLPEPAADTVNALQSNLNGGLGMPPASTSPKPHSRIAAPSHPPPGAKEASPSKKAASPVRAAAAASDPATAAARFGVSKLGKCGRNLPNPVTAWVAAIVHTIASDEEISGGDDSLTGMSLRPVLLRDCVTDENKDQIGEEETGLELRFGAMKTAQGSEPSLKGPKGDLICRIARAVMELLGKKVAEDGKKMFKDWEALRKHLCEVKNSLVNEPTGEKIKDFSFIWTGARRGGHAGGDFSQTYYERRFTPNLADLSRPQVKNDRKTLGGGGNPGLMEFFGGLFKQEFSELYAKAKEMALGDVATGVQQTHFMGLLDVASAEWAKVQANPELAAAGWTDRHSRSVEQYRKKKAAEFVADERNAKKHAEASRVVTARADVKKWMAANPKAIARSWLATRGFTTDQIVKIERIFGVKEMRFDAPALEGATVGGLEEFRQEVLAMTEESAAAASPPAAAAPESPAGLTRERSQKSDALSDDLHRQKRTMLRDPQAEEESPTGDAPPSPQDSMLTAQASAYVAMEGDEVV